MTAQQNRLSEEDQRRVDHVLDQWKSWPLKLPQRPEITRQPSAGTRHINLVICARGRPFVLRIHRSLPRSTSILHELTMQQAAASAGIAPRVIYHSKAPEYSLHEHIAGCRLTEALQQTRKTPGHADYTLHEKLLTAIEKLQEVAILLPAWSYRRVLLHYMRLANRSEDDRAREALRCATLLDTRLHQGFGVPCHHDLNTDNILLGDDSRLYLIDWEFSGRGSAIMDYAIIAAELQITPGELRARTGISIEALMLAQDVYTSLCHYYHAAMKTSQAMASTPDNSL